MRSSLLPSATRRLRCLTSLIFAALLLTLFGLSGPVTSAHATTLAERVAAQVRTSGVAGSTSVVVWDHTAQKILYQRRAFTPVAPASNAKLVTSAAALAQLGPAHRFTTRVAITGYISASGVLRGDVFLIGGGDPTLSTRSFARRNLDGWGANIDLLTYAVRGAGIKVVTGRVIADESFLDRQRYVTSWPSRYRFDEATALGGLTLNQSYLGSCLCGASAHQPAAFAATTYRRMLIARGVNVRGGAVIGRTPSYAREIGHVDSPPLSLIVRFMNRHSDNFTAEILLKDLGRIAAGPGRGSTATGAFVATRALQNIGVRTTSLRIADGSGLSAANRVTGRFISDLLNIGTQNRTIGPAWWNSFAVSGGSGTLRHRMSRRPYRGNVRGKTGTLSIASALSGYSTRPSGRRYGFSVITYSRGGVNAGAARALQDRIAMTLVR